MFTFRLEACASEVTDLCLEFPEKQEDEENPVEALKYVRQNRILDSLSCFDLDADQLTGTLSDIIQNSERNEKQLALDILYSFEKEGIIYPKPGGDLSESRLNVVDDAGDRATQDTWNVLISKLKRSLLNDATPESISLASAFSCPQSLWTSYSVLRMQYLQNLFRSSTSCFSEYIDSVVQKLKIYTSCAISDLESIACGALSPPPNALNILYEDVLLDLCHSISNMLQPTECNGRLSSTPDVVRKSRSEATFKKPPLSRLRQQSSSVENLNTNHVLSTEQLLDLCRFIDAASDALREIEEMNYCLLSSLPRSRTRSVKSALKPVTNKEDAPEARKIWVSYLDKHSQAVIATIQIYLKENVQNIKFCEEFDVLPGRSPKIIDKQVLRIWNNINRIVPVSKESSTVVQNAFTDYCSHSLKNLMKQFYGFLETIASGDRSTEDFFHVLASTIYLAEKIKKINAKSDFKQLVGAVIDQIVSSQMSVISSSVLQDADSQFWKSSQAFYEDERCSFSVQAWHTRMFYIRHHLAKIGVPAAESRKVLSRIMKESLDILVDRYIKAEPSYKKTPLILKDILTILLFVSDHLLAASSNIGDYLDAVESNMYRWIHTNCSSLLATMAIVSSPMKTLYRTFKRGYAKKKTNACEDELFLKAYPSHWLSWIRPSLIPFGFSSMFELQTFSAIYLQVELLSSQTEPRLDLLLEALTLKHYTLSILLLKNVTDEKYFTSVLFLLVHTFPDALKSCLIPIIDSAEEWSVLDGHSTPTTWLKSLITLLEPLFERPSRIAKKFLERTIPHSIFKDELLACGCQPSFEDDSTEFDSFTEALTYLIRSFVDLSASLPPALAVFIAAADTKIEDAPRKSVACLLFAAAARNTLQRMESTTLAQAIFSVLVFEQPSNKIAADFVKKNKPFVETCVKKIIKNTERTECGEIEDVDKYLSQESELVFSTISDCILEKSNGKAAFNNVHQLVSQNKCWVGSELEVELFFGVQSRDIQFQMPVDIIDEPFNPLEESTRVHGLRFEHKFVEEYQLDWERLLQNDLGLSEANVRLLMSKRIEFRDNNGLNDDELKYVKTLKQAFTIP